MKIKNVLGSLAVIGAVVLAGSVFASPRNIKPQTGTCDNGFRWTVNSAGVVNAFATASSNIKGCLSSRMAVYDDEYLTSATARLEAGAFTRTSGTSTSGTWTITSAKCGYDVGVVTTCTQSLS